MKIWENKIWCPVISTAVKQTRFMNGSIICGDETYWCPQILADIIFPSLKSSFMTELHICPWHRWNKIVNARLHATTEEVDILM